MKLHLVFLKYHHNNQLTELLSSPEIVLKDIKSDKILIELL